MEVTRTHRTLRLAGLVAAVAAALLLSGCSLTGRTVLGGITQNQLSAGVEPYFNVGGVTYQIQESRQLNPYSNDVEFFSGLKSAQSIPASDFWYGVFLWAKNQNPRALTTSDHFVLTDSAGNAYTPTPLNPKVNPFVWTAQTLAHNDIEPNADSIAGQNPIGGGLVLFRLPQSAYQNRPLTLHIYAQGASKGDSVSLDL
ncbi:MAG TPA: hypothetical protein VFN48_10485 [Solirubrobacteraceae bacterium]|nr:hypothetical protein [Solirubrobacteraceae bacterium]